MACQRWRYTDHHLPVPGYRKEITSQHWKQPPKFGNTSFVELPMKVGLQPSWWPMLSQPHGWQTEMWSFDYGLMLNYWLGVNTNHFLKLQGTISSLELGWTCCVKHGPKQAPHEKWLWVFSCLKMDLQILILELKFSSKSHSKSICFSLLLFGHGKLTPTLGS
jgi:hypothetical protein